MQISKLLYKPWGETRFTTGTTPTTWRFTGQREDATIGLYFYNARYLDPQPGRFISPDTIVPAPGNPQALNRYSYVLNNPLRYTDPTGRAPANPDCAGIPDCGVDSWYGYQEHAVRKYLDAERAQHAKRLADFAGNVVTIVFEPVDYAMTLGACAAGNCSVLALGAMVLPFVPGAVGRNADEVIELANDTVLKRAFRNEQDRFLRKGESGLSVHVGATDKQISAHLQGDVLSVTYDEVRDLGMALDKTPGAIADLDPFHYEIVQGFDQTWNQFKNALKNLQWRK